MGSGSFPFLDQVHSVSELRKEKPQMYAFMTLLSILLSHCELQSNSSELQYNTKPFGMALYSFTFLKYNLSQNGCINYVHVIVREIGENQ